MKPKQPFVGELANYPRGTRLVLHKKPNVYVITEEPSIASETNLRPGQRLDPNILVVSPSAHTVEVQEIAHKERSAIPSHMITRGIRRFPEDVGVPLEDITQALRQRWRHRERRK